jgi:hypothetical protein
LFGHFLSLISGPLFCSACDSGSNKRATPSFISLVLFPAAANRKRTRSRKEDGGRGRKERGLAGAVDREEGTQEEKGRTVEGETSDGEGGEDSFNFVSPIPLDRTEHRGQKKGRRNR